MPDKNEIVEEFIRKLCSLQKYNQELEIAKNGVIILEPELNKIIKSINAKVEENNRVNISEIKEKFFHGQIINLKSNFTMEDENMVVTYNPYIDQLSLIPITTLESYNQIHSKMKDVIKKTLRSKILTLTPEQFVELVYNLLSDRNIPWIKDFRLSKTISRDGGRDFSAMIKINEAKEISNNEFGKDELVIGQIKHLKVKAGSPDIQRFIGSLNTHRPKIKFGLFISSNGFSSDAIREIENSSYEIFDKDLNWLIDLMLRYLIGVKKITLRGLSLDEIFWKDISR